jgi:hypothetical protein
MDFSFNMSAAPKKHKHIEGSFDRPDGPEEFWKVIDLDSLIVWNKQGEEIERGDGKVPRGQKYGFSTKH